MSQTAYDNSSAPATPAKWFLEGFVDDGRTRCRMPIGENAIRVGGSATNAELVLRFDNISRLHAELWVREGGLWIRDLGSRNGTFVNRCRVHDSVQLHDGDIVHFASREFRVVCEEGVRSSSGWDTLQGSTLLPATFPFGAEQIIEILRSERVQCVYQPIVELTSGKIWAYEVLGRGSLEEFPINPKDLLEIAASLGLEAQLSRVFRRVGVRFAHANAPQGGLFVNIHPSELSDIGGLLHSMRALREEFPRVVLVAELHEAFITSHDTVRRLRDGLETMGIALAYDDFGAGQSRLLELAELPPVYLKFDRQLVNGIVSAAPDRREMVLMLVEYAHRRGVRCLAEGVETQADAVACKDIGFDYGQGYWFGHPESCPWIGSTVSGMDG